MEEEDVGRGGRRRCEWRGKEKMWVEVEGEDVGGGGRRRCEWRGKEKMWVEVEGEDVGRGGRRRGEWRGKEKRCVEVTVLPNGWHDSGCEGGGRCPHKWCGGGEQKCCTPNLVIWKGRRGGCSKGKVKVVTGRKNANKM